MNHGRHKTNQGRIHRILAIDQLDAQSAQAADYTPGTDQPARPRDTHSHPEGPTIRPTQPPGAHIAPGPTRRRPRKQTQTLQSKGVENMHLGNVALLFHVLVEAPASLSFLLDAPKQLRESRPSPEAVLVCQSYGGLLAATNVLCLLLLYRRGVATFDDASAIIAASLALCHVMPIRRAWVRIRSQGAGRGWLRQADALGGPYVHLVVHGLILVSLTWAGWHGIGRGKP